MNNTNPAPAGQFAAAVRGLIDRHNLTEPRAAGLLGVPVPTIRKWLAGTRAPSASAVRLIEILGTLEAIAPAIFDSLLPAPALPAEKRAGGRAKRKSIESCA